MEAQIKEGKNPEEQMTIFKQMTNTAISESPVTLSSRNSDVITRAGLVLPIQNATS